MSKPVIITTDSVCDMPQEMLQRYQVRMIPLTVIEGDRSYKDGVSITPDLIYDTYDRENLLPKTAAISPQEFLDFFTPLVESGAEIVHIDISAPLSGTYQNACMAADELEGVYPVDSHHLSLGQGLLVIEACRLRDLGLGAAEIARRLEDYSQKIVTTFVIDTLEYLWKGGRCSGVTALGANLLHIRPCLELRDGEIKVARKYRGTMSKVYAQYIQDMLSTEDIDPKLGILVHSGRVDQSELEQLRQLALRLVPFQEVPIVQAGCTVSSHCGPATIGFIFARR